MARTGQSYCSSDPSSVAYPTGSVVVVTHRDPLEPVLRTIDACTRAPNPILTCSLRLGGRWMRMWLLRLAQCRTRENCATRPVPRNMQATRRRHVFAAAMQVGPFGGIWRCGTFARTTHTSCWEPHWLLVLLYVRIRLSHSVTGLQTHSQC